MPFMLVVMSVVFAAGAWTAWENGQVHLIVVFAFLSIWLGWIYIRFRIRVRLLRSGHYYTHEDPPGKFLTGFLVGLAVVLCVYAYSILMYKPWFPRFLVFDFLVSMATWGSYLGFTWFFVLVPIVTGVFWWTVNVTKRPEKKKRPEESQPRTSS